jgi:hypothetical protein
MSIRLLPSSRVISERVKRKGSNRLLLPATSRWKFPEKCQTDRKSEEEKGREGRERRGRETEDSSEDEDDVFELLVAQLYEEAFGQRGVSLRLIVSQRGKDVVSEEGSQCLQDRGHVGDALRV